MQTKSYIKFFTWRDDQRAEVTLGPGTRINPATNCAQLGSYNSSVYPLDSDLYVKSRVTDPTAVRQWLGFEPIIRHKFVDNQQVTGEGFRLSDGTDEYWWSGAAWVVSTTAWNTMAEVAENISTFPVASKKLQVVVNLSTTDPEQTPELVEVRVLYAADVVSEIEDLVVRSLVPRLKADIRPVARVPLVKHEGDALDEISLALYKIDTDYRFVGSVAVYCDSDDPGHDTDLYQSHTSKSTPTDPWHDGTVDVITLSQDVAVGKSMWLELEYEPFVNLYTNQDFYELAHVPAIVVERLVYSGRELRGDNFVGDRGAGTAHVIPRVYQGPLELTIAVTTDKLYDSTAMHDEVATFLSDNQTLKSVGIDEAYRLRSVGTLDFSTALVNNELRTWRITVNLENVLVYARGGTTEKLITTFVVEGSLDVEVGELPPAQQRVVAGGESVLARGDIVTAGEQ